MLAEEPFHVLTPPAAVPTRRDLGRRQDALVGPAADGADVDVDQGSHLAGRQQLPVPAVVRRQRVSGARRRRHRWAFELDTEPFDVGCAVAPVTTGGLRGTRDPAAADDRTAIARDVAAEKDDQDAAARDRAADERDVDAESRDQQAAATRQETTPSTPPRTATGLLRTTPGPAATGRPRSSSAGVPGRTGALRTTRASCSLAVRRSLSGVANTLPHFALISA